jgi:GDPmannose 4,6-dehydratase
VAENQTTRLLSPILREKIELIYADLLDETSVFRIINEYKPDEIYNLAAMSHVRISFDVPAFTIKTNSLGVLNLLEAIRSFSPESKFYQASSSEMFGNSVDEDGSQRLTTPMNPVSPYGCSKLMAYKLNSHYRNAYGLHLTSGILFNHESPRRGSNFITNKVVKGAVSIHKGLEKNLYLGNLDSKRDWGHSSDYVRAIFKIMQYETPRDWIVATGQTRSVRDLCEYVFAKLDMDYHEKVKFDPRFLRKEELTYLRGDPSETKTLLNWEPKYSFEMLIDEMIDHWNSVI